MLSTTNKNRPALRYTKVLNIEGYPFGPPHWWNPNCVSKYYRYLLKKFLYK